MNSVRDTAKKSLAVDPKAIVLQPMAVPEVNTGVHLPRSLVMITIRRQRGSELEVEGRGKWGRQIE